ncbi:hypothetical protein [Rhodohalobacter sp.]|uniref:hypothetical protein n=1 Tax=Rhodohalobacter sp. TaxID=1974210 RepID=UPI002ACDC13C|nr:hypothetical protein [Rhodohalobacter sp.]MDZ7757446.1 hypothetical protein [Rhodohalobacter sp.]
MGQQQLLLVILVTIIVGLATVVAINTFQSAAEDANMDAIRQDILQAQSNANAYALKPDVLGGGNGGYQGITLREISLPEENDNALYELGEINDDSFEIIATSERGFVLTATISREIQLTGTGMIPDLLNSSLFFVTFYLINSLVDKGIIPYLYLPINQ